MGNSTNSAENKALFRRGLKAGVPIALGYFAVSFSLGITARGVGLNWFQGFLTSALVSASAGEYAGFTLIGENGSYLEMALVMFIANARYLLMACALTQRFAPDTKLRHRFGIGFYLTDELFGITIAEPGYVKPIYTYAAALVAIPSWAAGTALGIIVGNVLPVSVVSALSVALYGMFLAIIIPPAKQNKIVLLFVIISFAASFITAYIPFLAALSGGTRTIILTVGISAAAAAFFPVKEDDANEK